MPGTVTVACKIPNGLMLRVFTTEEYSVPVMTGGVKKMLRSRPTDWLQKINGPARRIGQDVGHEIVHGFGLTHGVDADKFALWMEQNKTSDFVVKGLVFGQPKVDSAVSQANEHKAQRSGMEPLDPQNLPAEFKGRVETAAKAA